MGVRVLKTKDRVRLDNKKVNRSFIASGTVEIARIKNQPGSG